MSTSRLKSKSSTGNHLQESKWATSTPYRNSNSNDHTRNANHRSWNSSSSQHKTHSQPDDQSYKFSAPTTPVSASTLHKSARSRSISPSKSKWAPASTSVVTASESTPLQRSLLRRRTSQATFNKLHRRLKWKATTLLLSYNRTFELIHLQYQGQTMQTNTPLDPITLPSMAKDEPETMFKIDFFEFYVLLERTLVALLGVLGIEVSAIHAADVSSIDGDGVRQHEPLTSISNGVLPSLQSQDQRTNLIGNSKVLLKSQTAYIHSYHANVLSALDNPHDNPLHSIFGTDPVRTYLGIAKAWRNKWKDAEEKEKDEREDSLVGSRYEGMLRDLRLEEMLGCILIAVEDGGAVVESHLDRFVTLNEHDGVGGTGIRGNSSRPEDTGVNAGFRSTSGVTMMDLDDTRGIYTPSSTTATTQSGPIEAIDDMMDWD